MRLRVVLLIAPVLAATLTARASKWSHPAAGASASGGPEVLLTFDDGPSEKYTPAVLDTLRKHGLHAVFFWVGHRVAGVSPTLPLRLAVVRRAIADGQLVGNHTFDHAHLCLGPAAEAARQIDESERRLSVAAGMPIHMFRTPYGSRCRRLLTMLGDRGIEHLHWDIDPQEWANPDTSRTVMLVTRRLSRLEGRAVLLMHDTHFVTARALPKILEWIDAENARRVRAGRPQIRIISFADVARERLAPGLSEELAGWRVAAFDAGHRVVALLPGGGAATQLATHRASPGASAPL